MGLLTTVLRHMLGHWGLALTVGSGTGWATAGSARCAGSYAPAWALGWGRTRHTCCWKTGQPACVCSDVVEGHWTWHWAEPQAQTSCIHPVLPSSGTGGSHLTPSTLCTQVASGWGQPWDTPWEWGQDSTAGPAPASSGSPRHPPCRPRVLVVLVSSGSRRHPRLVPRPATMARLLITHAEPSVLPGPHEGRLLDTMGANSGLGEASLLWTHSRPGPDPSGYLP